MKKENAARSAAVEDCHMAEVVKLDDVRGTPGGDNLPPDDGTGAVVLPATEGEGGEVIPFPVERTKNAVLSYAERGWTVVPLHSVTPGSDCTCNKADCSSAGKHPRTEHGVKDASGNPEVIRSWWNEWPTANVGVATGNASGVIVVDVDPRNGGDDSFEELESLHGKFPETAEVVTGGGGRHLYYRVPTDSGVTYRNVPKLGDLPGVEVKGDNGYVVAPPSNHKSGYEYEWEATHGLEDVEIAPAPQWLLDAVTVKKKAAKLVASDVKASDKIPEGERNSTLTSLAGSMRRKKMGEEAIRAALLVENTEKCDPPLDEAEVEKVAASVAKYKPGETPPKKNDDESSSLFAIAGEADFFCDERDDVYATVVDGGVIKNLSVRRDEFESWLQYHYCKANGVAAKKARVEEVITTFVAKARYEAPKRNLFVRFARLDDELWIDLGDEKRRAVKVTTDGWTVVDKPPPLFKRFKHMLPLPLPTDGGDMKTILDHLRLKRPEQKLLALTWLATATVADIPRPILMLHGDQGSGKSVASVMLRKIIDPSAADMPELHHDRNQLAQLFDQHAVPAFDNQSSFKRNLSDILCRAVSGGSLSKRRLYSNDDEIIHRYKRPIIMNGINSPIGMPDLMDRCIAIQLERLQPDQRLSETAIWQRFGIDHPLIFGGLLNTLVEALRVKPNLTPPIVTRMADFCEWGFAVAQALGYGADDFKTALESNEKFQTEQIIENDPLAMAVRAYIEKKKEYDGPPTCLLGDLEKEIGDRATHDAGWPRGAPHMTRRLKMLRVPLAAIGIEMDFPPGRKEGRKVVLKKVDAGSSPSSPSSSEGGEADEK